MAGLFKDILDSFNPLAYRDLSHRTGGQALWFVVRLLLLSWIIALLLFTPQLSQLQQYFTDEFGKIESVDVHGNISMSAPILMPSKYPFLIIDTTGAYTTITGGEYLLVTNDHIVYRTLGPLRAVHSIELSEITDIARMREQYGGLFAMLAVALLPAFIFWSFMILLLKYLAIALALSVVAWMLLELTTWKKGFGRIFSIGLYSLVAAIPLEVIALPFDPEWMIPIAKILYLKVYLIPLLMYMLLFAAALGITAGHHESSHEEEKRTVHRSSKIDWDDKQ